MILAFDLDGTLSDPIIGVAAGINHALAGMGLPERTRPELKTFIGPPLQEIFSNLLETDDQPQIHTAIHLFREYYGRLGYRQNILYPGIEDLLKTLEAAGHSLFVATNKKTQIANQVVDYFMIGRYFRQVFGSVSNRSKTDNLNHIRTLEPDSRHVMIGDRLHDMNAGKEAGFYCIGALWGYGSRRELLEAGADALCSAPDELTGIITELED